MEQYTSKLSKIELDSISRMDELSLYFAIQQHKTHLENLKLNAIQIPGANIELQPKITLEEARLQAYYKNLERFGIDIQNKDMVHRWMYSCSFYLNNLDIVEYILLMERRRTCQNLDIFGNQEEGKSAFYKESVEKQKIKQIG